MGDKQRGSAVLVMTDVHYGKRTSTYSPGRCARRLDVLGRELGRIRGLLAGYEFEELVIACLGDVNDGTDIYATQPHHQAITNVEQQAEEVARLFYAFSVAQADVWGRVRWECVPGNHGRAGKRAAEAANWDMVAYRYLSLMNQDGRVAVNLPDRNADPFLRVMRVYRHGYLIYHGHDIRAWGNIPWYGIMLRLLRWQAARGDFHGWQTVLMGHFHTIGLWRFNGMVAMCSGTMVTDDEWGLRSFGLQPMNQWWFFGVSPGQPLTWQFCLDVGHGHDRENV